MNFQPRVCPPPMPCIASRVGDTLELVFGTVPMSVPITAPRHRYRLQEHTATTVLATLQEVAGELRA